jgi:hypothetical protein
MRRPTVGFGRSKFISCAHAKAPVPGYSEANSKRFSNLSIQDKVMHVPLVEATSCYK